MRGGFGSVIVHLFGWLQSGRAIRFAAGAGLGRCLVAYRTWTRRLAAAYGDRAPGSISAGDLTDLIAQHVIARQTEEDRRRTGRAAEENAAGAYRHLWSYLVEKGYAQANDALKLRKSTRPEPRRRGFTAEEAALPRLLARSGRDPLLDELTLSSRSASDFAVWSCAACA